MEAFRKWSQEICLTSRSRSLPLVAGQPQSAHASHFMRRLCLPLSSTLACIMVRRLTTTKWYDYINWFGAKDEWSFELDGVDFRVTNQWIGPTKLSQGDRILAEGQAAFEASGIKPFLQAKVRTNGALERSITVYVKAILTVKIKVEVDGTDISNGFV